MFVGEGLSRNLRLSLRLRTRSVRRRATNGLLESSKLVPDTSAHLNNDRKIETSPAHPQYILTEHGVGYRFQPPEDRAAQSAQERFAGPGR